jgi:hypothetical protein
MVLHALGPLLQWDVANQSGDGHPCPHRPAVDVLLTAVIGFTAGEDDLKAQTPVRHCGNSNRQSMKILTMVLLMSTREFFADPALKVRDVACQVHLLALPHFAVGFATLGDAVD